MDTDHRLPNLETKTEIIPPLESLGRFEYLLRSTFRTCQSDILKGRKYTTEEAYAHVFIKEN
jgi:hypothetical protein